MSSPRKPREAATTRAAQALETRRRILAAAADLFAEHEYGDVQVGEIAARAGVAHGLPFHYFGSKHNLYLQVMHETAEQMRVSFTPSDDANPGSQLRAALAAHLRYLAHHRGLARRLILGGRATDPAAREVFEAARWDALKAAAQFLGLDAENAALKLMGRAAVAALDEATVQWLDSEHDFTVEVMVEALLQLIVSAVRSASVIDPTIETSAALDLLVDSAAQPARSQDQPVEP
ncbi:TetR/AcrR family transcriptional regulator [Actinokineospora sp. PR83]|uniref:TetR/AcrR family transcriptional regulator n=1 Tax=Actinokineospora sp. PR83 TaxID=2884908 RepID=UPI001F3FC5A1|nr:TetR/AcrR family transcriptional regulator [Actinokineospora sp. PR83]MCG8919747.1 TetR/AcrR family transcriptional regulator [Actinokineospora sp. PR83]